MNIIEKFDYASIEFLKKASIPFARFAIFIIYFWFGILKIFDTSAAIPLVEKLMEKTFLASLMTPETFLVIFSIYEMAIGILFLIPRLQRPAILLFSLHMVMTGMPLVLLTETSWQSFLTPTLEGQYIIKNLSLIALVAFIGSRLTPLKDK
ncbi:MAG: hypothetical protein U1D31_00875 [Patescibacteria group bacterium]|nr:hypothetical protein [bacterium]MDZ4240674.1 hypothetical protein [Patescibacteria group bacterium]